MLTRRLNTQQIGYRALWAGRTGEYLGQPGLLLAKVFETKLSINHLFSIAINITKYLGNNAR